MDKENKKREIGIIISLMVLLISLVWVIKEVIQNSPKFLVYENSCENKTDFIPEDCLVLSNEEVNGKFVEGKCTILLQEEENKLYHCLDDKYIVEIKK